MGSCKRVMLSSSFPQKHMYLTLPQPSIQGICCLGQSLPFLLLFLTIIFILSLSSIIIFGGIDSLGPSPLWYLLTLSSTPYEGAWTRLPVIRASVSPPPWSGAVLG